MTAWKNITLSLPGLDLNLVSNQLSELDIASISIIDKRDEFNSDWFDDPNNPTKLHDDTHKIVLLVPNETESKQLINQIRNCLNLGEIPKHTEEIVEDKDWVLFTQSNFKEILISDSLRIIPPWENDSPFQGESVIIQPGSGFGTGTHPTTQLCLNCLHENIKGGESVLDYGCGSGILSIGAKKFGAKHVEGVEIDTLAIQNANINNKLNQTTIPFHHVESFQSKEKYNIVIANILSSVLIQLSLKLKKHVKDKLILSGILENQLQVIQDTYAPWISLSIINKMDGWFLLGGTKNKS